MDDLWQQFHRLPKTIRDSVATKQALAAVDRLEQANPGLDLADFVMRLMVKEFSVGELPVKLQDEAKLSPDKSQVVAKQIESDVLMGVADYLGVKQSATIPVAPVQPVSQRTIGAVPPNLPTVQPTASPVAPAKAPTVRPLSPPRSSLGPPPLGQPRVQPPFVTPSVPAPTKPLPTLRPPSSVSPQPFSNPGATQTAATPTRRPLGQITPTTPPVVPKPASALPPIATPTPAPPIPVMAQPAKPIGAIAPTQEYSEEETAEIERQTERVKGLQSSGPADFDDLAKRVLDQHHLAWPDELMTRRAQAIAKARLKEIRSSEETQTVLVREPKVGGLGLDPDLAKQLTADLEIEARRLKDQGMVRPPDPLKPLPPVVPPPIQPAQPLGQPPLLRTIPAAGLPSSQPGQSFTEPPRPTRLIKRPVDIPAPAVIPPVPGPMPAPTVMQRPRQQDRPTLSDITRPQKTFGPGEEMKSLTLTEWRRLGQGAAESARVIFEKFQHLQRESFSLWTSALTGWRQSEVYQLYLDMGRQSLDSGLSIQEVIAARAKAGQTYLSEHEFYTVTDLNRMLQH